MPGIGGGGSSQPAIQPVSTSQGNFQIYQPQAQQQADYWFQGLENQLNNLGWSGLSSLPGGVTPTTQLYPQVGQVAQTLSGINPDIAAYPGYTYAYGPYGNIALAGAASAANMAPGITNPAYNNAIGAQNLGASAAQNVYGSAYNPLYGEELSFLQNDPTALAALAGAQTGAGIGGQAAGQYGQTGVSGQIPNIINNAVQNGGLTAAGSNAAGITGASIPALLQLLSGQAGLAGGLSGAAAGLNPELRALYGQTVPGIEQAASNITQNVPMLQSKLETPMGATTLRSGAQNLLGLGNQLAQTPEGIQSLWQAGRNILNTGYDPQSQLFNQQSQQLLDQSNAINAMSGLGSSPYGAGLTQQALSNFDINWQNQQLGRQAQALGAAQGAFGEVGNLLANREAIAQNALAGAGGAYGQAAGINQTQANLANEIAALQGQSAGVLGQAGNLGAALNAGQLQNLAGASNIFNQQAQGAGGLGGTIGNLAGAGLGQQVTGQSATSGQLAAALGLGQGAAGLSTSASAAPTNLMNQLVQRELAVLQAQNQAGAQGAGALTALGGQQQQALQTGLGALQGNAQLQGLPYQTAFGQGQNALQALTNQANFGNELLNLPQQSLNNLEAYLGLGQSAGRLGGNLGLDQTALQAGLQSNALSGLGSIAGGAGLGSLIFGSGGLSGALGLNPTTGLLGSLGIGAGADAAAGGGLLDFASSIPFFL